MELGTISECVTCRLELKEFTSGVTLKSASANLIVVPTQVSHLSLRYGYLKCL